MHAVIDREEIWRLLVAWAEWTPVLLKQIVLEDKWVVGKPGMGENDEFSLNILLLKSIWTQKWRHWMAIGYENREAITEVEMKNHKHQPRMTIVKRQMRVLRWRGKTMLGQSRAVFSFFLPSFYSYLWLLHCLPCPFLLHDVGLGGEGEGKRERRKDKTGRGNMSKSSGRVP